MRALKLRLPLLLLLAAGLALASRAVPASVLVVSSERSAAFEQAADAMSAELRRDGDAERTVVRLLSEELDAYQGPAPRLYMALGTEACMVLARTERKAPVLCTLLPRASFERVLRESGRRSGTQLSALYLNQPVGRKLDLVKLALPNAHRIGVLLGAESQQQEAVLRTAASVRNLKVVSVAIKPDEPLFNGLKKVIDEADLLLALADPQVYNSASIQNILLTSFRAQVPMMAFSPAYVRAGALLAVYSTPEQIGRQAGAMARAVLNGQPLGAPQFPLLFEIGVNEHVARSLGLKLDARELGDRLRRLESAP